MKDENYSKMYYSEKQLWLMGFSEHDRNIILDAAREIGEDPVMIGEFIRRLRTIEDFT